jgi:hypothetical protein
VEPEPLGLATPSDLTRKGSCNKPGIATNAIETSCA